MITCKHIATKFSEKFKNKYTLTPDGKLYKADEKNSTEKYMLSGDEIIRLDKHNIWERIDINSLENDVITIYPEARQTKYFYTKIILCILFELQENFDDEKNYLPFVL